MTRRHCIFMIVLSFTPGGCSRATAEAGMDETETLASGSESGPPSDTESESESESESQSGSGTETETETESGAETESGPETESETDGGEGCGDGQLDDGEACDDGNVASGDGCSALCQLEDCAWDTIDAPFPINVHPGESFGQIDFDDECNLLVAGAMNHRIYRVSRSDGSVAVVTDQLPQFAITGLTYRASDGLIYVTTNGNDELLSIDGVNPPVLVTDVLDTPLAMAVAPEGFGDYGDQIITITQDGSVFAIDPEQGTIDLFAVTTGLSSLVFAPDGTLYVARFTQNRIDMLSADGTLTAFAADLEIPDGLAVDVDGSRLFVSHFPNGSGRIDEISIPDAVVTPGPDVDIQQGFYVTGMVVDAVDQVIYKIEGAGLDSFVAN
jgi:cysteine-rich repeat protein